jgi:hypothetical protein
MLQLDDAEGSPHELHAPAAHGYSVCVSHSASLPFYRLRAQDTLRLRVSSTTMQPRSTLLVAAGLALAAAAPPASYNTVPRRVEGMVNVHIVPHSHDDVRAPSSLRRAQPTNPRSAPRRLGGLRRSINTTTVQTTRSSTRTSTPSSARRCSRCSRTRTGASSRSSKHSSLGGGQTRRLPSRRRCRASLRAGSSNSSTEGGPCTTRRAPASSTCSTTRTSASASSSTRLASCPRLLGRLIRSATAASRAACSPRRCREST